MSAREGRVNTTGSAPELVPAGHRGDRDGRIDRLRR